MSCAAAPASAVTIGQAEALYRAGDYAAAAASLQSLSMVEPPDATVLRLRGLCRCCVRRL